MTFSLKPEVGLVTGATETFPDKSRQRISLYGNRSTKYFCATVQFDLPGFMYYVTVQISLSIHSAI